MCSRALALSALAVLVACHEPTTATPDAFRSVRGRSALVVNSVTDLGTLGGAFSVATAVNRHGAVVGQATTGTEMQANFLWTSTGGMIDLGNLGGPINEAFGINDSGTVVGVSQNPSLFIRAFLWTQAGGITDLASGEETLSQAFGINNFGQVILSTNGRAFLWSAGTGMQNIGALLDPSLISAGNAISDSGYVALSAQMPTGGFTFHAFRWTAAGGFTDLGTLGGTNSFARGVNNLGHVVGVSQDALGRDRAFLWTPENGMEDLGTLPGGSSSEALGINDNGEVVGSTSPGVRPFFWTRAGGMEWLPGLFGPSSASGEARAITNNGYIAGNLNTLTGLHAVLWSVQPPNVGPTANAGTDQTLTVAAAPANVTLNGSASTDPDDGIATYEWREGATIVATGAQPTVSLAQGTHSITLRVTDHAGASSEDVVVVVVNVNVGPTANAGADQTVTVAAAPANVTLNGSASTDPDDGIATYEWREGATVIATGAQPTVSLAQGTHTITLRVTDHAGVSSEDVVVVVVNVVVVVQRKLTLGEHAKLWIGLKHHDDDGLRIDLRAEVLVNGVVVGSAEAHNLKTGGTGFDDAVLKTLTLALTAGPADLPAGAQLSFRPSVRRTCSSSGGGYKGEKSGTVRLWYNGEQDDEGHNRDAGSRFRAGIGGTSVKYFLRKTSELKTVEGHSRTFADVAVNSHVACPSRPYQAFGSWSVALP